MKNIKRYIISTFISLLLFFGFAFLLNTLNYFNVLNNTCYKSLLLIFMIISAFAGSYYLGNQTEEKGYQKGLIFGALISLIFLVLSALLKNSITISSVIYYIIIIITSTIGSTIGINKKTTETNQ